MGQSLKDIAQKLQDTDKKVQLIYAFNGVGKHVYRVSLRIWLSLK